MVAEVSVLDRPARAPVRWAADFGLPEPGADSFADIYHEYFPRVCAYLRQRVRDTDLALDLTATVFEKAYVKRADLRSANAAAAWLFTIARNELASHWRREIPRAQALERSAHDGALTSPREDPEESLLQKERTAVIMGLVRRLPRREYEVISLKFDAEFSNQEIASELHTSEVNVRVTMFRALRRLRRFVENGAS